MFFEQRLSTREFGKAARGQHGIQEYVMDGHSIKDVEMAVEKTQTARVTAASPNAE